MYLYYLCINKCLFMCLGFNMHCFSLFFLFAWVLKTLFTFISSTVAFFFFFPTLMLHLLNKSSKSLCMKYGTWRLLKSGFPDVEEHHFERQDLGISPSPLSQLPSTPSLSVSQQQALCQTFPNAESSCWSLYASDYIGNDIRPSEHLD